jgi:hypothetical protein
MTCRGHQRNGRRAVPLDTVAALSRRTPTDTAYVLCEEPDCEVVYLGAEGDAIAAGELVVRPGFKSRGDEALLCYCFEVPRGDLRRAAERGDEAAVPREIRRRMAEGQCRCRVTNPSGRCCLADVEKAARALAQPSPSAISQPAARRGKSEG